MKKGTIRAGLLALTMIFGMTSCGASEAYDKETETTSYANKTEAYYAYEAEAPGAYMDYAYAADTAPAEYGMATAAPTAAVQEAPAQNDLAERKIIKNASLRYETRTYDDFLAGLSACIRTHGGFVQSQENYGGSLSDTYSQRSAYMTVRIPLDRYDMFMSEAGRLGLVTYKSESSQDVTMNYVDTESRIKSLQTEYDALLAILEKSEKLEDVITLQSRISEVTYELESYQSQLRKYDDLIAYCTVNIDVSEVERETPNVREMTFNEKITAGLDETFEDIRTDASDFAIWFVTSFPYFVIWAVFVIVVLLILRVVLRCRRRRTPKNPTPPTDAES